MLKKRLAAYWTILVETAVVLSVGAGILWLKAAFVKFAVEPAIDEDTVIGELVLDLNDLVFLATVIAIYARLLRHLIDFIRR